METKKLRNKINKFLDRTENGMLTLNGQKLSVADCDSLLIHCDYIDGNLGFKPIKPMGSIAVVLERHELKYW